ncbi:aminoacyl-tRNA hydrolase, partial [Patescibacteria group bacterium]
QKENSFPEFHLSQKFNSQISEGSLDGEKVVLVKPHTFMNNSGKAVKSLVKNYNLEMENLIIIHDDIDLPLGKIRISIGRGTAGHKGVDSVIVELGTKEFTRLRIGVSLKDLKPKNVQKFVLKKFLKREGRDIKEIGKKSCLILETIITKGLEKTKQEYPE